MHVCYLAYDSKISSDLSKHCSVHQFVFEENTNFKREEDPIKRSLHACSVPGLSGLHLMNTTESFKHVKAIEIIWIGVCF